MKHSENYINNHRGSREVIAAPSSRNRGSASASSPRKISIIAGRAFENEVLGALLRQTFEDTDIRTFATVADWTDAGKGGGRDETVLYNLGEHTLSEPAVKARLHEFIDHAGGRHVIVISRTEDLLAVFHVMDCGASAYISPSAGVEELVEAIRAPTTRSVVISRSSLTMLRKAIGRQGDGSGGLDRYFTERQLDVAHALRRGDANKTIAFDLGLCESTVKVHIRNIMRKLRATNRTQAAYRLNELANGSTEIEVF